ncbi:MAG: hypothetical protein ACLFUR_01530 [Candidatus Hadarchaeia archaeon]
MPTNNYGIKMDKLNKRIRETERESYYNIAKAIYRRLVERAEGYRALIQFNYEWRYILPTGDCSQYSPVSHDRQG